MSGERSGVTLARDVAQAPWRIAADHPALAGHFPGQPILPGVVLLAGVLEAVRADAALAGFVGAAPTIAVAKFTAPVRPGSTLAIAFERGERSLAWVVRDGERIAASGQLAAAAATGDNEAT